jgi:hypothetical protein
LMDKNGITMWMGNVWHRWPLGLRNQRSLLVWNLFRSHATENNKNRLTWNTGWFDFGTANFGRLSEQAIPRSHAWTMEYLDKEWWNFLHERSSYACCVTWCAVWFRDKIMRKSESDKILQKVPHF